MCCASCACSSSTSRDRRDVAGCRGPGPARRRGRDRRCLSPRKPLAHAGRCRRGHAGSEWPDPRSRTAGRCRAGLLAAAVAPRRTGGNMPGQGRNLRGNTCDRKRRRRWVRRHFGVPVKGNSRFELRCFHCRKKLEWYEGNRRMRKAWQIDRFPICGHNGGRYRRDNIVPSCPLCNYTRCPKGGCHEYQ